MTRWLCSMSLQLGPRAKEQPPSASSRGRRRQWHRRQAPRLLAFRGQPHREAVLQGCDSTRGRNQKACDRRDAGLSWEKRVLGTAAACCPLSWAWPAVAPFQHHISCWLSSWCEASTPPLWYTVLTHPPVRSNEIICYHIKSRKSFTFYFN